MLLITYMHCIVTKAVLRFSFSHVRKVCHHIDLIINNNLLQKIKNFEAMFIEILPQTFRSVFYDLDRNI